MFGIGTTTTDLGLGLLIVSTAALTAGLALWMLWHGAPARRVSWVPLDHLGERTVFLFEDDLLVDATPEAHALLQSGPSRLDPYARMVSVLERSFPGCADALAKLGEQQTLELSSKDRNGSRLRAEWRAGLTRITVADPPAPGQVPAVDGFGLAALTEELETLRLALDDAPILMWREEADGSIRWANGSYLRAAQARAEPDTELRWPLPRLFDPAPVVHTATDVPRRLSLSDPDTDEKTWYEVHASSTDDGIMMFALPADALIRAEGSLREFVQTLTKTFAHLTTGLAVFDRDRKLALFNPALTDLSGLEPLFLSSRPSLFQFLDRLREHQRMPEPKDYKSWRRQIGEMETAAASGTHIETWTLPNGQTYRVTGRPHPEGAVAFLFEDISAEISATRRFRSQLELGQAVLDGLEDAMVVFSPAGAMLLTNAAFDDLWGTDMGQGLSDVSVAEAIRVWSAANGAEPTGDTWEKLRESVLQIRDRTAWSSPIALSDGRALTLHTQPLSGNNTLIRFQKTAPLKPAAKPDWGSASSAAGG